MKERKDLAKTYALMQTIKDPLYKNFIEGKLVEVSKKDWNKKSGQVQRYKKSGEIKSTVTRNKGYTEREHEWGKIRYDKGADDKFGKFSRIQEHKIMGTIPKVPVTKKGISYEVPFYFYNALKISSIREKSTF